MYYKRICKKCGKEFITSGPAARYCLGCMDISGQKIGLWEVLYRVADRGNCDYWECRCNGCGRIKEVNGYNLRSKKSQNCGCVGRLKRRKRHEKD